MAFSKRKRFVGIGVGFLIAICLLIAVVGYLSTPRQKTASRPLVLIHTPVNRDRVDAGTATLIHATARHPSGITRMELWADGELIATTRPSDGEVANPLVLSTHWQAHTAGRHILLVRALSAEGVYGQATVYVNAHVSATEHVVAEGETLESIAEAYEISPESLAESNPDLPESGPAPGDVLELPSAADDDEFDPAEPTGSDAGLAPDDLPTGSDAGLSPEDMPTGHDEGLAPPEEEALDVGSPPDEVMPAPDSAFRFFSDFSVLDALFGASGDGLRHLYMEILAFDVLGAYEDTRCYASLADSPWELSEVRGASQYFTWREDTPLPVDIACVGITGGGTDSVDLGRIAMRIPSEHWDGVARTATSTANGFRIEYVILDSDTIAEGNPLWLDPDMTPPTDLVVDKYHRQALVWEYHPRPDEEEIYGFAIYLNGTLQWVEPYRGHVRNFSDLPPEWLYPPCGETYTFTVTAVGPGFPEGPESLPAPPALVSTSEDDCEFKALVTFYDLITHDLGSDGDADERTGDVGPVYGHFFANDARETFSTGTLSWNGLGLATGISHNTTYDLSVFAVDEVRSWSGFPSMIVTLSEGDRLEIGFHIMDEDSGRCNWHGDPDCDDLVCEGSIHYTLSPYSPLYEVQEGRIVADNGRCEVNFRIEPAPDTPRRDPSGYAPAPYLAIEHMTIDDDSGHVFLEIKNRGTATVMHHDLFAAFTLRDDPEGEAFQTLLLAPDLQLAPGDSINVDVGRVTRDHHSVAFPGFCVVLDPDNEIPESVEISGATDAYRPYCPPLPDLKITNVLYDADNQALEVTIENPCLIGISSCGDIENRTIEVAIPRHDGEGNLVEYAWHHVNLGYNDSITLTIPDITEDIRGRLTTGYTLVVDPTNKIAERHERNNRYTVERIHHYWVVWQGGCTDYFERWRVNHVFLSLAVDIAGGGDSRHRIVAWNAPEIHIGIPPTGRGAYFASPLGHCLSSSDTSTYFTEKFRLAGDERLIIRTRARLEAGWREWDMGMREWTMENPAEDAYDDNTYSSCEGGRHYLETYFDGADDPGRWAIWFSVCRDD